jgi:hypothetical protein
MEISKGNSLYSCLKQRKMSFFSFTKSENRWAKQALLGGWYQWEGGGCGERV